jgi:hypothetical protein
VWLPCVAVLWAVLCGPAEAAAVQCPRLELQRAQAARCHWLTAATVSADPAVPDCCGEQRGCAAAGLQRCSAALKSVCELSSAVRRCCWGASPPNGQGRARKKLTIATR